MKLVITIVILLEIDLMLGTLIQFAICLLAMRFQKQHRLNEWILTVRKKQIACLLIFSEMIRIIVCYKICKFIFSWLDFAFEFTWLVLILTCIHTIIKDVILLRYAKQIQAECK